MKFAFYSGLLLLMLLDAKPSYSGGKGNQSEGAISYFVDYSCFEQLNQKELTYLQVHFFIPRRSLIFAKKDTFFMAGYSIAVLLKDLKDEKNLIERSWTTVIDDKITAQDTSKEIPLIFENNFAVKPGNYSLQIIVRDQNDSTRTGRYSDLIGVPDFRENTLSISSVELASQIIKGGNPEEMFVKNGLTIYPNPSKFFGSNLPRLFIYAELYNLENKTGDAHNTYTVEFIITDEGGSVVKEFPAKTFNKNNTTAVVLHSINIISLGTGRYQLIVRATDDATKKIAQSKEVFVVFREGESLDEVAEGSSFFKDLDEKGMERFANILDCMGSNDEKKTFKQLDFEGKKNFLDRFWKERDPSPGTKTNELLSDYVKRYEDANQRFGGPNRAGWKSEMGRVYIVYGPPGQIEKHEFEPNNLPYQIWYYYQLKNQPTQTLFIFAEKDEYGLRLIHSNARGEVNNSSWQNEIRK